MRFAELQVAKPGEDARKEKRREIYGIQHTTRRRNEVVYSCQRCETWTRTLDERELVSNEPTKKLKTHAYKPKKWWREGKGYPKRNES